MRYLLDTNIIIHKIEELKECRYTKNSYVSQITIVEILKRLSPTNYKQRKKTVDLLFDSNIDIIWGDLDHLAVLESLKGIEEEDKLWLKKPLYEVHRSASYEEISDPDLYEDLHRFCEQQDRKLLHWIYQITDCVIVQKCKNMTFQIMNVNGKKSEISEKAKQLYTNLVLEIYKGFNREISYLEVSKGFKKSKSRKFFLAISSYGVNKEREFGKNKILEDIVKLNMETGSNQKIKNHDKRVMNKRTSVQRNDATDLAQILYMKEGCTFVTDDLKISPYFNNVGIQTMTFEQFRNL